MVRSRALGAHADIDEFRLIRILGSGAMGTVYLAHDSILDRAVALKIVRVGVSDHGRMRFLTEARAIARLHHPNVVAIYRAGTTAGGEPYLIQELINGQPLDRIARPVDPARCRELARGLARGLAAAHRHGVLHRDVKPSNIMVDEAGTPRLLDFGLAKLTADRATPPHRAGPPRRSDAIDLDATVELPGAPGPVDARTTSADCATHPAISSGLLIGTPRYMAPEVWRGEPATARSDLYSFGVVLYELLTGEPPFGHGDRDALRDAVLAGAPRPIGERGERPPEFAALILRCLAVDASNRPESADEVVYQLDRIAAGAAPVPEGNPYRGLAAFEAAQRSVFFGRGAEIASIVERLRGEPFVVVTGDSGIGKSSLCRAGVLPAIEDGALGDGRTWTARTATLGRRPVAALAELLELAPAEFAPAELGGGEPHLLASAIGRRLALGADRGLVLLIDQLEELVTQAAPTDRATATAVLAALGEGIAGVKVVVAIRGDFLTRVAAAPGLRAAMTRSLHLVRGLSPEDAREVIVGPARAKGVAFAHRAMIDELAGSIADRPAALPLLEFALAELWAHRDAEHAIIPERALREIGGVAGALAAHADRVITTLAAPERHAARRILLALVTPDETRAVRERGELTAGDPTAAAALEALVTGRLVAARDVATGDAVYELAHESLLTAWGTLRGWLDDVAGQRPIRMRLHAAAAEWQRLGRRRELLWRGAQLAEVAQLAELEPVDRAFLAASRRARRARTALALALVAAIPVAGGLAWLGLERRDAARLERRIDGALAAAHTAFADADTMVAAARGFLTTAIAEFDAGKIDRGEATWAEAEARLRAARGTLREATSKLETVVVESAGAPRARAAMAEAVFRQAELAEDTGDAAGAGELIERLTSYDDGTVAARWHAAVAVAVTAAAAIRIEIDRYVAAPDGSLQLVVAIAAGRGGALRATLAPGSYRARVSAPGIDPVILPFVVRREPLALAVALPAPGQVPPGFVFIPAGRFLTGANGDPAYRREFLLAPPLYDKATPSYLIARYEVTFAEWLTFLRELAPDQRRAHQQAPPRNAAASVRLEGRDRGPFTLILQPTELALRAREGEPIVYPHRARAAIARWERLPASGVSFDDAVAYARWLDATGRVPHARLCRQTEWERAARGADGRRFPHGDRMLPGDADFDETYGREPSDFGPDEVGTHPASDSPFGISDAAGNALEWVSDEPPGVTGAPRPAGTRAPSNAMSRGGSWYHGAPSAHVANHIPFDRTSHNAILGIRICADP